MAALVHLCQFGFHIVAQIIKPKFIVCRIGHITTIRGIFFGFGLLGIDHTSGQAQGAEHLAHPFGVTLGEVVVHRHNMHALAGQRVQIRRERRDKSLAFTRFHFGNIALMQEYATHQLHIKRPQTQGASRSLTTVRKCLWQQIIKALTAHRAFGQFFGFRFDTLIAQCLAFRLQRVDLFNLRQRGLNQTVVRRTENLLRNSSKTEHILSARACFGVSDINV